MSGECVVITLGTRVMIVHALDEHFPAQHIGKTGSVVKIFNDDTCVCDNDGVRHIGGHCANPHVGESNNDPAYSVRGDDGFIDMFWGAEIGKLDDMDAFP